MGRLTKKFVILLAIFAIVSLPVSVTAAGLDCLFHDVNDSQSMMQKQIHHQHDDVFAAALDMHDLAELSMDDHDVNGADNGCATSLVVSVATDHHNGMLTVWGQAFLKAEVQHQLVDITLPAEIKPPIFALS